MASSSARYVRTCSLNAFLSCRISHLWLLALLEELLLSLLLVGLLPSKVLLRGDLVNLRLVNAGQVNLLRCGDNVAGVDSSERHAVDLEWAGDEEDTLWEALQEDDVLAAEAASEEDEHGTGSEAWPWGGGPDGFADLGISCQLLITSLYIPSSSKKLRDRRGPEGNGN